MDFQQLLKLAEQSYLNQLPFVIYARPNETTWHALFQKTLGDDPKMKSPIKGFVLSGFDQAYQYHIPFESSEQFTGVLTSTDTELYHTETTNYVSGKQAYLNLLRKTVSSLSREKLKKVVLSRNQTIPLSRFKISELINRCFNLYPAAYRYIWYHPETDFWCGATPELLIHIDGMKFHTMSLAGTRKAESTGNIVWSAKEYEEQQIVTESISDVLEKVSSVIKVSQVKNAQAGSLIHLRTDFNGVFRNGKNDITLLLERLHPTPAVCGTPTRLAKAYIQANEGYDRSFYAGYLGEIDSSSKKADLYVNLRCMNLNSKKAKLFVGGGVTKESVPEEEWEETQNKLQTMLQLIHPFL